MPPQTKVTSRLFDFLVEKGADIDKAMIDGLTPLLIASFEGHLEVVRYLVENGVEIEKAQEEGASPLLSLLRKAMSRLSDIW